MTTTQRAKGAKRAVTRLFCAIGRHHWQADRYWSIGGLYVEGYVCRDCRHTHRERKVLHRP